MRLLYDLSKRPASFDFITCLATAKTLGCTDVRFVLNGWKKKNYKDPEERFRSIVEPAVKLWGMDYSVGEPEGVPVTHFFPGCFEAFKKHGRIEKIPVRCEDRGYVTITLRGCGPERTPERNSKDEEWRKFAATLDRKVIWLRDYEQQPLDLQDRMKLYAGAHMNFFVINGPATLCIHSEAPYLIMRTIGCERSGGSTSPSFMRQIGITPGFQFPWSNHRQMLSYKDDTAENIAEEYAQLESLRLAA